MVCEVPDARGVIMALEDLCWPFRMLPFTNTIIMYHNVQSYVLPEQWFSMAGENGLGAELVSRCGIVNAWTEDLPPCFVRVLNMLDFMLLGSMHIGC